MNSILSKAKLGSQPGARPPAAVELSPQGVLAAATPGPGQPPVYAFEPLPQGALVPGIGEPNLRAPEVVANAIRAALGQVSPRTRAVTLVLPDTVVRVFVLDFDSLPAKAAEAIPVLRFRLRKMVPFDVEHAGVSYQVLVENKTECKVLAAVLPGPVLAEYEAAVRAGRLRARSGAAHEPGGAGGHRFARAGAGRQPERAGADHLDHPRPGPAALSHPRPARRSPSCASQEVQRGIAVAAAYFEDKLGAPSPAAVLRRHRRRRRQRGGGLCPLDRRLRN